MSDQPDMPVLTYVRTLLELHVDRVEIDADRDDTGRPSVLFVVRHRGVDMRFRVTGDEIAQAVDAERLARMHHAMTVRSIEEPGTPSGRFVVLMPDGWRPDKQRRNEIERA